MRKNSIKRWFFVTAMWSLLANLVHPVTPRHFMNLGLKNNMFGWAYAGMAFTNFLFSPFWGKMADKYGTTRMSTLCIIGYGLSQTLFGFTTTTLGIMAARIIGGVFIGGVLVCQLMYVVENSTASEKGQAMVTISTLQIVVGTIGYFIGGRIGDISIHATFLIQVIGLMLLASFVFFFIADNEAEVDPSTTFSIGDINPFSSLVSKEAKSNRPLQLVMILMIFFSIGQTTYDQTFNYYMADFYQFPPSVNGNIRSITGILAFIVNSTLCLWLIKNTKVNKSLAGVLAICSGLIMALISVQNPMLFLMVNVIYFVFVSMAQPLIQHLATSLSDDHGKVSGSLNALKSLGMVIGGIFAGQMYQINPQFPFISAIIVFAVAAILSLQVSKKVK